MTIDNNRSRLLKWFYTLSKYLNIAKLPRNLATTFITRGSLVLLPHYFTRNSEKAESWSDQDQVLAVLVQTPAVWRMLRC